MKGVELEANWVSPQGIDARLAITWADATEEIGGRDLQLTQAPRWSRFASFGYSHDLASTVRASFGIDLRYRGTMFSQRGKLFPCSSFAHWGVAVIGRNVTNRVLAFAAGPDPDPYVESAVEAPEALRRVLLSGWFRR